MNRVARFSVTLPPFLLFLLSSFLLPVPPRAIIITAHLTKFSMVENLSFSSLNCNSRNMSQCTSQIQKLKIYGICKLRTDFILLSDIRMVCKNKASMVSTVMDIFKTNPYKSYHSWAQRKLSPLSPLNPLNILLSINGLLLSYGFNGLND